MKLIFKFFFLSLILISENLLAVEFKGQFIQGSFILGKTMQNSRIFIDKKEIKVSQDGYFVFGIGRDRKNDITIDVLKNKDSKKIVKKIYKREYKIQKIDGLPKKQVTPPKEVYERIKKDNILIGKARSINSDLNFFKDKFTLPVKESVITGVYGSQRILNGKPRRPHFGLDFAAREGTPVRAMISGIVTLAESDLYFTGGTIIFDHGHGISTLYMHMKDVNVKIGQNVKRGEIIGTVGKTGRSTGPHLDVRLNWFDIKLDPASVLKLN
ncbi:M23 family metallopeptidase [Pelagibacteraceae bacterium]|nr:M23 family metallopeptidase [Pelagibacteraceae bacterium]